MLVKLYVLQHGKYVCFIVLSDTALPVKPFAGLEKKQEILYH